MEAESADLVRMTLVANGASPELAQALIPSRPLEAGEQYRFHFDMTKCIGCRSCEVACNEQNGNPAHIQWRRVGELEGGVYPNTQRTYLSMGCNHCLSADCLRGCPVNAYTKDPLTGIVLHSTDACIGCQYCVWNCPYSVPQFNAERGVVGKCDMCRGRLLDGREPACVNACPENAIQIEIVNKEAWGKDFHTAESPGMPAAGQTVSTTRITLPERSSSWLERVDTGSIHLEHAHPSLIAMTTVMQASFGALAVMTLAHELNAAVLTSLWLLTTFALNVSVFHLGRPAYAWRAIRMWRRSWLSREVLCFGLFYGSVTACAAAAWLREFQWAITPLAYFGILLGMCGTLASAALYLVKARPSWNTIHTPIDFLVSAAYLGSLVADVMTRGFVLHRNLVLLFAMLWGLNQSIRIVRLRSASLFEWRASYNLLRGEQLFYWVALAFLSAGASVLFAYAPLPWLALFAGTVTVVIGRYLFFVSVVPLSMGLTFIGNRAEVV
ncbi:DmsC/YnfH family molybdoenzyme membrane anchor subunit [Terriglobus sp. TAA 43]|uniref:DmsC/YnfH family molybdoenzyme membrane anchor subunit n=1 Tax=Terriglobus sp. TAA 43 TaxID=278961 RepID=UPI001E3978E2|nr:DmsC/YnfH family molybdoenzyme membrane anchor subunit [Terriglobus sp. TAA 43]